MSWQPRQPVVFSFSAVWRDMGHRTAGYHVWPMQPKLQESTLQPPAHPVISLRKILTASQPDFNFSFILALGAQEAAQLELPGGRRHFLTSFPEPLTLSGLKFHWSSWPTLRRKKSQAPLGGFLSINMGAWEQTPRYLQNSWMHLRKLMNYSVGQTDWSQGSIAGSQVSGALIWEMFNRLRHINVPSCLGEQQFGAKQGAENPLCFVGKWLVPWAAPLCLHRLCLTPLQAEFDFERSNNTWLLLRVGHEIECNNHPLNICY